MSRFTAAGLDPVTDCSICEVELVFGLTEGEPTHLTWECHVEWVHPACSYVVSEAVVAVSRSQESNCWDAVIEQQATFVTDAMSFKQLPHELRAIVAITKAVSEFNDLGGLQSGGIVVQKVWGSKTVLTRQESHNGNLWITMGVAVEAICSGRVASAALMLIRNSSGWYAEVVHLYLLEPEAQPVLSRLKAPEHHDVDPPAPAPQVTDTGRPWPVHDRLTAVSHAVARALEVHNRYEELGLIQPISAVEIMLARFSRCTAGGFVCCRGVDCTQAWP